MERAVYSGQNCSTRKTLQFSQWIVRKALSHSTKLTVVRKELLHLLSHSTGLMAPPISLLPRATVGITQGNRWRKAHLRGQGTGRRRVAESSSLPWAQKRREPSLEFCRLAGRPLARGTLQGSPPPGGWLAQSGHWWEQSIPGSGARGH